MDIADSIDRKPLIVLTEDEYMAILKDEPYRMLADEAREDNGDSPGLSISTMRDVLAGRVHPLAAWRNAHGLSQAELAEKAGVRTATVSDIEGGRIDPRISTVKAIAGALSLGIGDIT